MNSSKENSPCPKCKVGSLSNFNKNRNGFLGKYFREEIREKIAAYRLLSSIDTIDAELYSFDARTRARVKKALAK